MTHHLAIAALALGLSAPALADSALADDLAESRLRGCLLAGAAAPGQADLRSKVMQVRAFCGAQINRVRDLRVAAATQGLNGAEADTARADTVRALNDEIALAIANYTGLSLDDA